MPDRTPLETAVAHYLKLYRSPGWNAYVRDKVRALANEFPELYAELPRLMNEGIARMDAK